MSNLILCGRLYREPDVDETWEVIVMKPSYRVGVVH